jgi:hypothetical protein
VQAYAHAADLAERSSFKDRNGFVPVTGDGKTRAVWCHYTPRRGDAYPGIHSSAETIPMGR